MKRTLKSLCAIILCLQVTPAFPDSSEMLATERALSADFESFFKSQVANSGITGAAFVVANPGGTLLIGTAGYTDTSRKQPIDENTTFRVASVSKTFAAGLTALLVAEGEFGWEDPVTAYVPGFRVKGDAGKVQIRHVLGQSTGLIPHAYDNLIEDGVPIDRIRDQFRNLDFICPPGQCYSYQNSVFSLIEPVIERTTKASYADLMRERIFVPVGMKTASVGYDSFIENPNHASPHVKSHGHWKTVAVKPNYYEVAPAAGVNASASDLGKWLTAQMGGYPSVFDQPTVENLTRPRVKTVRDTQRKFWRDMLSDAHYGLGWRVYQLGAHEIIYHSGWVSGFRADVAWSEEHQIGIAVLMNVEDNSISELTTTFWKMAFDRLAPNDAVARNRSVAAALPARP
jgi:beta-lactamase class C